MEKIKKVLIVLSLVSLFFAFCTPPLSAYTIKTPISQDDFNGDRYDDNIFEIEFPTAEEIKSILDQSSDREADIELIKSSGLPVIITLKDSVKDIVSCDLSVRLRTGTNQDSYPLVKSNNGKEIDGI